MKSVGHAQAVSRAAGGGNLTSFPNFCNECDRKVRFDDKVRSNSGGGNTDSAKRLNDQVAEKLRPSHVLGCAMLNDMQTGELPLFAENKALQQTQNDFGTEHRGSEIRLRGKLKWLFEQDRMFWESNSAKSSHRGSPVRDVDRSKSLINVLTPGKPVVDSANDAKLVHVVEESFKRICSKKAPTNNVKPPKQQPTDKAMVSSVGELSSDRQSNSSAAKAPWTFSNSTAKFWPLGKSKTQILDKTLCAESKARNPAVTQNPVGDSKRVKDNDNAAVASSLDDVGEEILSDYDDAPKSGNSSDTETTSDEEDEVIKKKLDFAIAKGGDGSLKDVKNQAAYLKARCEMLAKEKNNALRKWKKSCQEIDDASKMAQTLRTAIETLLEASGSDPRADLRARKDILEDQTEALKMRMERLRRKSSQDVRRLAKEESPKTPLDYRVETLKRASKGRSLESPTVPRDTEYKVEALRTRLEKLMLATNSRISKEQVQRGGSARERKKPVEDWLRKSQLDEKAELKMKSWFNSLSAELTSEASPATSRGTCDKCSGASGFICRHLMQSVGTPVASKQATPSTSKQESPWSSAHDRDRDGSGSAPFSEETKKNVIHKIAEEVRLEAEQWYQVQELLGRVGEDMNTLQEACSTWERRAIVAEAQVVHMQREGEEKKQEKTVDFADEKFAELQKEMLSIQEAVNEVKKQMGNNDPHSWFEAAHTFGYAFMPVKRLPDASCVCTSEYKCCDKGTLHPNDQWRGGSGTSGGEFHPSSSANSSMASSTLSSELTSAEDGVGQRSPIQQCSKKIDRAGDEIVTSANASGQICRVEFESNTVKEMASVACEKLLDKPAKPVHKELAWDSSGSRGDMLLQMQASIRERTTSILQQDEQQSRHSNLTASRRPLKDVFENIVSEKENKQPY